MILKDYITQKFQTFGISLSEADLLDMYMDCGLTESTEMTSDNMDSATVSVADFIPSLLLRASSIRESGFSMSWNIEGIKDYYSMLCKKYGLEDKLSDKPQIIFL
jgi:hypothetical protein